MTVTKCENVPEISAKDHASIAKICLSKQINLVVIGPEVPLVDGLVDSLKRDVPNIRVFGPRYLNNFIVHV